jgi:hypothetical protein
MGQSTFSGPVKSLAGFISAGVSNSVTTAAGKTLMLQTMLENKSITQV